MTAKRKMHQEYKKLGWHNTTYDMKNSLLTWPTNQLEVEGIGGGGYIGAMVTQGF